MTTIDSMDPAKYLNYAVKNRSLTTIVAGSYETTIKKMEKENTDLLHELATLKAKLSEYENRVVHELENGITICDTKEPSESSVKIFDALKSESSKIYAKYTQAVKRGNVKSTILDDNHDLIKAIYLEGNGKYSVQKIVDEMLKRHSVSISRYFITSFMNAERLKEQLLVIKK